MLQISGPLFEQVQKLQLFSDSKTFVDARPKRSAREIMSIYKTIGLLNKDDLKEFITEHFELPVDIQCIVKDKTTLENYIAGAWQVLKRDAVPPQEGSTLFALPFDYYVPGGRFRELYYWDSYFTALGLIQIGDFRSVENLINNFIFLQKTIGLIPNGSRYYYYSRSQPPVLVLLVDLLYQYFGISKIKHYLAAVETEYTFWMTERRAHSTSDPINRYCDPQLIPRPESFSEDYNLAQSVSPQKRPYLYQAIRSAAESGWDFSSRWMADYHSMHTLMTQDIAPLDLNALLYLIEKKLEQYYSELRLPEKATAFRQAALSREKVYAHYFWNEEKECFTDFNLKTFKKRDHLTAAVAWPLFAGLATPEQAEKIAFQLNTHLLQSGGLSTSTIITDQQWDAPNAWPPLQWIAVIGLENYGYFDLAYEIMSRWNHSVCTYFNVHKVVLEKYNADHRDLPPVEGEYEVQEGFGWTNSIYLAFQKKLRSR